MKNFSFIDSDTINEFSKEEGSTNKKPEINNIKRHITIDGIVVYDKYLICLNKVVPETAGAKFVVSDKGDIFISKISTT